MCVKKKCKLRIRILRKIRSIKLNFSVLKFVNLIESIHILKDSEIGVFTKRIIYQTHYEKSDWSRAFNQFTIACELDMINAISAADIAFNVCLVTKPLGVFSEIKWLNASLLFLRINYVKNV